MGYVLSWPKRRPLTTEDGVTLLSVLSPGRLELRHPDGRVLTFTDPAELRAFAMQAHAAAVDYDLEQQLPPGRGRAHLKHQRRAAAEASRKRPADPSAPSDHAALERPA